jgi:hypothetical protein
VPGLKTLADKGGGRWCGLRTKPRHRPHLVLR